MLKREIICFALINTFFVSKISAQCSDPLNIYESDSLEDTIQLPSYPNTYPSNSECTWVIESTNFIEIEILEMIIEPDGCQYDYLEIHFDSNGSSNSDDRLCGNLGALGNSIFSGNGPVTINFISDSSVEPGLGFKLQYKIIRPESPESPPTPINPCLQQPCGPNSQQCLVDDLDLGTYICICENGFEGDNCEGEIDECLGNNQCQNGSECLDLIGEFVCQCLPGYEGVFCEDDIGWGMILVQILYEIVYPYFLLVSTDLPPISFPLSINECAPNICNSGTCIDGVNSYQCQCNNGYSGENCQIPPVSEPNPIYPGSSISNSNQQTTINLIDRLTPVSVSTSSNNQVANNQNTVTNSNSNFPSQTDSSATNNLVPNGSTENNSNNINNNNIINSQSCNTFPCLNLPSITCIEDANNQPFCRCPPNRNGIYCENLIGCYSEYLHHTFNFGDPIRFNCTEGSTLNLPDNEVVTCLANGEFDLEIPKCLYDRRRDLTTSTNFNQLFISSSNIASSLTSRQVWQLIKSVKWLLALFITSIGVLISLCLVSCYAFIFAPWNQHQLGKSCRSVVSYFSPNKQLQEVDRKLASRI